MYSVEAITTTPSQATWAVLPTILREEHSMHRTFRIVILLIACVLAGLPVSAHAQDGTLTDWQSAFEAGQTGMFQATSAEVGFTLDQSQQGQFMVGILNQEGNLESCEGDVIANVQPKAHLEQDFTVLPASHPFVALLLTEDGAGGFIAEDIRGIKRNGYCGIPASHKPVHGGTADTSANTPWPFKLYPCWPFGPYGENALTLRLWPDGKLNNLFWQHLGWETIIQGDQLGDLTLYDLDMVTFIYEGGCGKKSTVYLPTVDCPTCPYRNFIPITNKHQGVVKRWPSGMRTYLPYTSKNMPLRGHSQALDSELKLVVHESPAPASTDQNNPDPWPSLCALNTAILVTEDGADATAIITSTRDVGTPTLQVVGDRIHWLSGEHDARLTYNWVSPGRVDGMPCSMVIASNSNKDPSVIVRTQEGYLIEIFLNGSKRVVFNGAVKAGYKEGDVYTFWVAYEDHAQPFNLFGGTFGVVKIELDVSTIVAREIALYETMTPVYDIKATRVQGQALLHLVEDGYIRSLDPDSMQLVRSSRFTPVARMAKHEERFSWYTGVWTHVTPSLDGRYLIIGSGKESGVTVVDLQTSRSWNLDTPLAHRVLGVSVKHSDGNSKGLLAVHGSDRIFVMRADQNWTSLTVVAEYVFPELALQDDAYLAGPQMSVSWGYGDNLVASANQADPRSGAPHRFEFLGFLLSSSTLNVTWAWDLTWDPENAWANHSWSCVSGWDTDCSGPPPATPTAGPTPTPRPSPTMHRPEPTPTATPCIPEKQYADMVALLDNSSSMTGEKFQKAQDAIVAFAEQVQAPNQMALVSFAQEARTRQELTADMSAVVHATRTLLVGQGTRLDLGIAEARRELNSPRHRQGHEKVIILLSDGRQDKVDEVRKEATAAKAEGVKIFVIGLGGDVDQELLKEVATSPDKHYFYAPQAGDLARIYKEVAKTIPCP